MTNRKQTGVGYPQLSAILECADAAHGLSGHVISDGGCTCPGDFSKVRYMFVLITVVNIKWCCLPAKRQKFSASPKTETLIALIHLYLNSPLSL